METSQRGISRARWVEANEAKCACWDGRESVPEGRACASYAEAMGKEKL
jgi:hypothetical protein